jgi:glucose/arabinose dehydrogenase
MIRLIILGALLSLLPAGGLHAARGVTVEHEHPGLHLEEIASGLGITWGMTFIESDRLLLTQRSGQVYLLDLDSLDLRRIDGAPAVATQGQGGLLDVAAGPNYANEGWIYFTYTKAVDGGGATTLARARLRDNRLVDWQELLVSDSATGTGRHFGSRIAFDEQGHVFFGIGDRGERDPAQDLGNHIGAIIRLNLDGSVPADNPFVGEPGARPEIWSYGHRNPQGLLYDRETRRLWSIEHGPRGGDEINLVEPGLNYGWPVISYGKEYWAPLQVGEGTHKAGMEQPVKQYTPSIAPGSLLIYRGDAFPEWRGNLFAGALKLTHLNRVVLSPDGKAIDEERLFGSLGERIRALAQDQRGWLYLSTDSGRILRLRPES